MAFRPALARRRATARADDGKLSRSLALHRRSIARAIGGATHCDVSARVPRLCARLLLCELQVCESLRLARCRGTRIEKSGS
jgi:hypothetical protein